MQRKQSQIQTHAYLSGHDCFDIRDLSRRGETRCSPDEDKMRCSRHHQSRSRYRHTRVRHCGIGTNKRHMRDAHFGEVERYILHLILPCLRTHGQGLWVGEGRARRVAVAVSESRFIIYGCERLGFLPTLEGRIRYGYLGRAVSWNAMASHPIACHTADSWASS